MLKNENQNLLSINSELVSGEKEGLLQLPSDKALMADPAFRPLVEKYAAVHPLILALFSLVFFLKSCFFLK